MRKISTLCSLFFVTLLVVSCHRKDLEDPYLYNAYIPIVIDWSESLVVEEEIANVSIYFYPSDGGDPIVKISDDIYFNVVQVPAGSYSVLIINEMVGDIEGISYENYYDYSEFKAMSNEDLAASPSYYTSSSSERFVLEHERVGTWTLDNFVVDNAMIEYTRSSGFGDYLTMAEGVASSKSGSSEEYSSAAPSSAELLDLLNSTTAVSSSATKAIETLSTIYTQPATTIVNLYVRIQNLNSANEIETVFRGTASGYHVVEDRNLAPESGTTNIYNFMMEERSYDDPTAGTDGWLTHTFNTFGRPDSNESYSLEFDIVLNTGELMSFHRDVTAQVLEQDGHIIDIYIVDGDGASHSDDDGDGYIDDNGEGEIVLPEDDAATGFEVNPWGDAIVIPL